VAEREFKLPDLGEGLTDGEVVRWLVAEGDAIALNQPIVEVETAKAVVEIPSPYAGTVVKLHAGEGDTSDVGAPLISVDTGGGAAAAEPAPAAQAGRARPRAGAAGHPGRAGGAPAGPPAPDRRPRPQRQRPGRGRRGRPRRGRAAQRPKATPPVRRYAKDRGVDLAALVGTGRDGRITREDVDGALDAGSRPPRPAAGRRPRGQATARPDRASGSRFAAPAARSRPP
jgi:pyruvate dehydrogenase E2 component (dihydrolipoamide acetyltransferase)